MINLGEKVRDKLTDFKGTVTARAEYLYGCVWICVVPKTLHDDKPVEDVWFDEKRLEVMPIRKKRDEQTEERLPPFGGPPIGMPRRSVPTPHK